VTLPKGGKTTKIRKLHLQTLGKVNVLVRGVYFLVLGAHDQGRVWDRIQLEQDIYIQKTKKKNGLRILGEKEN